MTFQDGSALDANDVVRTYRAQWDAEDPAHTGRTGDFTYFSALFGGFLNAAGRRAADEPKLTGAGHAERVARPWSP